MAWQQTPYTLPLLVAAMVSGGLLVFTARSRTNRGAVPLLGVLVAATTWSVADAVRLSSTDVTVKVVMNDIRFIGPVLVTVSIFLFAAEYTNREEWLAPRRVLALFFVHAVTLVFVVTNPWHHLVRQHIEVDQSVSYVLMDITWGPWYYIHASYSYLLLVAAAIMLVMKLSQSTGVQTYRGQALAILIATLVPWGMNAAFIAGLTEVDLTSIGFTVTGSMFVVAVFRYQILDILPIARSTVVDNIEEGYIVLDSNDNVVDVNEKAAEILGTERDRLIGRPIRALDDEYQETLDRFSHERETRDQVRIELDGETRHYDIDISPVYDQRDRVTGRVVLIRDITEQERRQRQLEHQKAQLERQTDQLERQNERLEDFASIVSHDLRNPINVVSGRLELARQSPDEEHFDEMEAGLKRMESIIDDMLMMARQGQAVSKTELVSVPAIAEDAWSNVDTKAATLDVETTREVQADRGRLLQIFENLFRNAIDHGREDVSIRVGDVEDGFFVADDGPGIPEAERDSVLDKGYTTADDGTGFGLSIVQTAVQSHGWDVEITDSESGGARFEISGVGGAVITNSDPISQD
ncbi:histidine kinase N-terminal 7TM domain-containing protein [Halorientalis brevis]|uniref:histidine kinase n=1 Tax=Halorientalis brevis TaxID=1126241 RepID=A0ABD6CBI4_9EURY|nr:histidine kinase N-terminal 7TM domain-containing protein [Halorientalis brevis]